MYVAEMALHYLRMRNEGSQFRRHMFARGLGFHVDGDDFNYEIDTIKAKNLQVKWLPCLAYGVVDVAGRETYLAENRRDLGLCVINSPIFFFIPRNKKQSFAQGFCLSIGDRFIPHQPALQPSPRLWPSQVPYRARARGTCEGRVTVRKHLRLRSEILGGVLPVFGRHKQGRRRATGCWIPSAPQRGIHNAC